VAGLEQHALHHTSSLISGAFTRFYRVVTMLSGESLNDLFTATDSVIVFVRLFPKKLVELYQYFNSAQLLI
jgi:hypothetical protein